ncbi:MAG: acyl-CoA thioesterase, partial [Campylobacteraceae bacterium]|nr:acyl-CoA thioesterase [Campylobacteraceae bacterium]
YFKPAALGDVIDVKTEILQLKGASIDVLHTIYKGEEKLFSAKILIVFVKEGRPLRLTDDMREFFLKI